MQKYLPVISVVLKNVYLYVVFDFANKSIFIGLIIEIILLKNNYSYYSDKITETAIFPDYSKTPNLYYIV